MPKRNPRVCKEGAESHQFVCGGGAPRARGRVPVATMFNIGKAKTYGLNIMRADAKGAQPTTAPAPAAAVAGMFGDDDDDDGNAGGGLAGKTPQDIVRAQLELQRQKVERDMRAHTAALVGQDPTLIEYDEVYDKLKAKDEQYQERKQTKQSIRGKPKYVEKLIHEAEKRKLQTDLWYERKLQREEEAERALFGETEKFVTPAFVRHLEELKQFEEAQAAEEKRNAATTQGMQGFMANLIGLGSAARVAPAAAVAASTHESVAAAVVASESPVAPLAGASVAEGVVDEAATSAAAAVASPGVGAPPPEKPLSPRPSDSRRGRSRKPAARHYCRPRS